MTLTQECAGWALEAVEGLADERVEHTRELVADSLAVALAAAGSSGIAQRTVASVTSGAQGRCRVLGTTHTVPPVQAAFANAALAHALDFDDTHDRARVHTTTVLLPAALAMAEESGAEGSRVLHAVAVGAELMCRWSLAALAGPGSRADSWYLTQLLGGAGAAVTAGLVRGAGEAELVDALSHAVDQASGAKASSREGEARSLYPGHAASQGVAAALLARGGVRGARNPLEGELGLWRTHLGTPAPERIGLPGPAAEWESDRVTVKPWPGCRAAHPYIDAVRRLPEEVLGDPEGVEAVTVAVDSVAARLCFPPEQRRRPRTLAEAGFSVPFLVALALAGGGTVGLGTLTGAALADPRVLTLADRVSCEHRLADGPGYARAEVAVAHRARFWHTVGSPSPVPGPRERAAKFSACLAHGGWHHHEEELRAAVGALAEGPARDLLDTIGRFERRQDRTANA